MRRNSVLAKVWPLFNHLVNSQSVSTNGGFSVLLPSFSLRSWYHTPVAVLTQRLQSPQGYNGANLRFQHLKVNRQCTTWAERGATERSWKDTLFSSPGALSADNATQNLFISDTHHHRIIIADGDGRVLDCIGSSPGMEDGTFETAQLYYPVSTAFDANQNFLYIVDSENHAIRRADLSKRHLGTVYPPKVGSRKSSIWGRFLSWVGTAGSRSEQEDEEAGIFDVLRYPWHLKFDQHGSLLIASHCFENMWVLDSSSGKIIEYISQGSEAVFKEFLSMAIDVKETEDLHTMILNEMNGNDSTTEHPLPKLSAIDIVSRVARLRNWLYFVDTEGQIIRRCDLESGNNETLHLSNLGLLGLPWWWSLSSPNLQSTDDLSTTGNLVHSIRRETDNLYHQIHVQPGRCLLCINPVLPSGMVLAAPLEERSTWRQAKGCVVELSMFGGSLISHKISSAQKWVDDLDDLDDPDLGTKDTTELIIPQQSETGIPLYSLIDASLGAGEVVIDAVLYLKGPASLDSGKDSLGHTERADKQSGLQEWIGHQEDQIFLTHLHVKVRLEIASSSPEERTKYIIVQL